VASGQGDGAPSPSLGAPGGRPAAAEEGSTARAAPAAAPGSARPVHAMVALVVVLLAAAAAIPLVLSGPSPANAGGSLRRSGHARHVTDPPLPEAVTSITPASGASGVQPDATVAVTFSDPLAAGSPEPTLSPAVAGTWQPVSPTELAFTPSASFIPATAYTLTVPGGGAGVRAKDGSVLGQSVQASFTVAPGSTARLQQLLASLGYLPLAFDGPTPPAAQMALPQPGIFMWRDQGFPAAYTSLWDPTQFTALTRGAIMAFETQNGLDVDGNPGPQVWAALLADAAAGKSDAEPVTYVLVSKSVPQHLTVWVNGALTFADVPCNTGVPGATTADGTFEVFSHVRVSNMRGTDVTGSKYDVTVPWASYFEGGEALHGYPRAFYGYPQSNGCVEMPIYTAGRVWPDTPIGTVVTVAG
jgi:peptidoglycan hydrolase-like protein with peptidoglycan-binding domain